MINIPDSYRNIEDHSSSGFSSSEISGIRPKPIHSNKMTIISVLNEEQTGKK